MKERLPIRIKTELCVGMHADGGGLQGCVFGDEIEVSFVLDGRGIHSVFGEENECRRGDIFIVGGGIPHGFYALSKDEGPTVCTLIFNPSLIFFSDWGNIKSRHYCGGIFRDSIPYSYALLSSAATAELESYVSLISAELEGKNAQWQDAVRSHLTLLLIFACRYIDMADTVIKEHPTDWFTVSSAMRIIDEGCGSEDVTLERIASELYVSTSHLSRIFRKATGQSFADYVKDKRLSLACKLLKTTSLTNQQIVKRCGLKDVPSFYSLFKSKIGMTPYQYRMSQNENGENVMSICLEISEQLQKGKSKVVKELVQRAIDEGLTASQILNDGLLAGMNIIGGKFKNNEVYVPEVLVAARAMNAGTQLLKPLLVDDGVEAKGRVCIGTVQGDLHDIGKNLVKMMMEGKGLEVIDLGTDVAPETFVSAAVEHNCQIICCSALLTTTMEVMADVVKCVENAGIRDKVKIMVGGAPLTDEFCKSIGADVYAADAASAADAAVELCK